MVPCESAIVEMSIELLPADADDAPADVYHAVAMLPFGADDIEWRGYTTRAIGYGISAAVATARCWSGQVRADELEEACAALPCVQSARVIRWYTPNDTCPFDLAWLNPPFEPPRPDEVEAALARRPAARPAAGSGVAAAVSPPPRLGLVCTFRAAPDLRGWLLYHCALGVRAFHLYADGDADAREARALLADGLPPGVAARVVGVDEALARAWRAQPGWSRYGPRLAEAGSAVMARQCLNAEHAMMAAAAALARERAREAAAAAAEADGDGDGDAAADGAETSAGLDAADALAPACEWLCHCDADELVCAWPGDAELAAGGARALGALLAAADAAGIGALALANHEVALERALFASAADAADVGEAADARCLAAVSDPFGSCSLFKCNERAHVRGAAPAAGDGGAAFLQYNNGKSLAKVGLGARPHGVHKWLVPTGAGVALVEPGALCVLHYCEVGFPAFAAKAHALSAATEWFGQAVLPFRQRAQRAALAGPAALQDLFRTEVLLADERAAALVRAGACVRVAKVAALLGDARAAAAARRGAVSTLPAEQTAAAAARGGLLERWRLEFEVVPAAGDDDDDDDDADGDDADAEAEAADEDCARPRWATEVFARLRARARLPCGARVAWVGWRAEPFMFGLSKMVVIAVATMADGDSDGAEARRGAALDEAADEMIVLLCARADAVQAAALVARARLSADPRDDAYATCRRLFVSNDEADARWRAAVARGEARLLGREQLRGLLRSGYARIDDLATPAAAASVARVAAASIAIDPVVGPDGRGAAAAPSSADVDGAADARALLWRWPEPRTARGDCTAWLPRDAAAAGALPPRLAALAAAVDAGAAADIVARTDGARDGRGHAADVLQVLGRLDALRRELGEYAHDPRLVGRSELQLARYAPGGGGYKTHTDALPDDGARGPRAAQRNVTAICYCNAGWAPAHGGALRLTLQDHDGAGTADVLPAAGVGVVFLSGCVPHEVLPTAAVCRYALTAWYSGAELEAGANDEKSEIQMT
jgi:translation elongation factor EF-1beta